MKGGLLRDLDQKAYMILGSIRERGWNSSLMVTRRPEVLESTDIICELAKDAEGGAVWQRRGTANGDLKTGRKRPWSVLP